MSTDGGFWLNLRRRFRFVLFTLAFYAASSAFSQTTIDTLMPRDARSMAMGGSSLVFAEGYGALWGNPAGLARKNSFTMLDISAWAYLRPTPSNIGTISSMLRAGTTQDQIKSTLDSLIAENGVGAGESLGIGWIDSGIGIGLTSVTDSYASGSGLSSSTLDIRSQTNAVVGMAWKLDFGPFKFDFGANVRGYYRIETLPGGWKFPPIVDALVTGSDLMTVVSNDTVRGGFGVSLDAGATLSFGSLGIGLMVRDVADAIALKGSTIREIVNSYMVPSGGLDYFSIAPIYTAGLSFSVGKGTLMSTSLFAEVDDPLSIFKDSPFSAASIASKLRSGLEIEFLKFLSLRSGFNQGYFSFGAGMHLLFLEFNAAVFTEPLSVAGGRVGRSGIMVQGAIRF